MSFAVPSMRGSKSEANWAGRKLLILRPSGAILGCEERSEFTENASNVGSYSIQSRDLFVP